MHTSSDDCVKITTCGWVPVVDATATYETTGDITASNCKTPTYAAPTDLTCGIVTWNLVTCTWGCQPKQTTCATAPAAAPADMTCTGLFWNDQVCKWECPSNGVCKWNT